MIQKVLLGLLIFTSFAVGSEPDDRPDKHGIYRISDPAGKYSGTAFVVKKTPEKTILATAGHVVCADDAMTTIYSAGYEYPVKTNSTKFVGKVKVLMVAKDSDIALVEGLFTVDVEVLPIDPEPVPLPKRNYVPSSKTASVLGYGAGQWTETTGRLSFVSGHYLQADCIAVPGQSGGPVVSDGRVVGCCSGGSAWYHDDPDAKKGSFTWPLRAGSGKRLKELVDLVK
jgi:V8-like Glu-specific endopeptidase